ncbi:MAG: hypothetical protein IH891_07525, partial [Planctomycetes bacterium]|nr:hypothetical protein [Planctomycetota bacterium]
MKRLHGILTLFCATLVIGGFGQSIQSDVVTLKSGAVIRGTILKRNHKKVWLDVGPDVLEFSMEDVDDIEAEAEGADFEVESDTLFHTALNLPELS